MHSRGVWVCVCVCRARQFVYCPQRLSGVEVEVVNEPRAKWGFGVGLASRYREMRSRSENLYMLSLPPGPCQLRGAFVHALLPQARALRGHGEHHLHPSRRAQKGLVYQKF